MFPIFVRIPLKSCKRRRLIQTRATFSAQYFADIAEIYRVEILHTFGQSGGSWGARDQPPPPFVSHVLRKQPTTGGKDDMKIW